jgi:putative SOS response-associated peptidase YedK
MCGRYVIISTPEAIRALFGYAEQPNFPLRYNVAPTQPIPIVHLDNGKRVFALARWAFLPSWAKDPKTFSLVINARGESVLDKPAFRAAMRRRRCLIPNDGFYEWKPGAPKQPFFVRARRGADGSAPPLAFAGLWETWTGPNGEEIDTVAIITTTANRTLADIHHRMPVFVPPEAFDLWLDCARFDAEQAASLIKPADDTLLEVYAVSSAVNRMVNDSLELTEPVPADYTAAPESAASAPAAVKTRPRKPKVSDQASLF